MPRLPRNENPLPKIKGLAVDEVWKQLDQTLA
jgi:hypothetical protein